MADEASSAEHYVDLLRQKQFAQIEDDSSPGVLGNDSDQVLASMAGFFPSEQAKSVKALGYRSNRGPGYLIEEVTVEYEFRDRWLLVEFTERKTDEDTWITEFRVTELRDSVEHLNRFTLAGKGVAQYVFFLLGLLSLGISLYACVVCFKTKLGRQKWLWLPATLVGVSAWGVNWTTGQLSWLLLAFHVPPVMIFQESMYRVYTVLVTLPLGAIVFLLRRRNMARRPAPVPATREQ